MLDERKVLAMSAKKTPEEFAEEVRAVWGDRAILLTPYTRCVDKVLVRFTECGHECWKNPNKLLAGQGCGVKECHYGLLSRNKTRTTDQFASDLSAKGLRYELLSEFTGIKYPVTVRNLKCGHVYTANAGNILQGSGCPVCYGHKNSDIFARVLRERYRDAYKVLGPYVNGLTPILVEHRCGYIWRTTPKTLLRSEACPRCNRSQGERNIERFLTDQGFSFATQYWFDDCRDILPLPFDFAVFLHSGLRLIEFDGSQHYGKSNFWGKSGSYEKVLRHDAIKNVYCREHSIPLLRIPYWKSRTYQPMLLSFLSDDE